ncbi:DUF3885 domain-containing protein [Priestia taiwanensis]|uniref:DUF3885 domain-containing protein n=1 Tax=Priestia taiwanensis TaxID=1347902 RepID=A0A917EK99_9BACI|nr:DUF3885 domain-containing protein [Priestia taiwanensis]MBM7361489.1 hypothetical protein [Priestia taiwanensis]GGE54590.1 hypothetical protein GCM10007140_01110 [Priestia taiwanensis]
MKLENYLAETFPNLVLRSAVFYSWEVGVRYELGVMKENDTTITYLQGVYNRAIALFHALHLLDDEVYIVIDVNDYADGKTFKRKLNIFAPYVKKKEDLYRVHHQTIPYVYPEDNEEGLYKTHRFTLRCRPSDIRYVQMIQAICNQDMGMRPKLYHCVYFINRKNDTIFHVYDDRGCDVIATSTETIRYVYDTYNEWILDYDRPAIDNVFNR